MLITASWILGAYLLGAVPFGFLIGRARGVDIRTQGSRNIGATNVGRVLGRKWGLICLTLDILKGFVPTLLFGILILDRLRDAGDYWRWLAVGLAAVLGHLFPIYLQLRGGKGVATTIGVGLGIFPIFSLAMLAAVAAYFAVRLTTRMVSPGSLALAVVFPVAVAVTAGPLRGGALADYWPLVVVATALGVLIIVRHRENIRRLLRGEEHKVRSSP